MRPRREENLASHQRPRGGARRAYAEPAPAGWGSAGSFRPAESIEERAAAVAAERAATNGHTAKPSAPPRQATSVLCPNGSVPVSGGSLWRFARQHEEAHGPGMVRFLTELGTANNWGTKVTAWSSEQVAQAYAEVEAAYDHADADDDHADDGRYDS